MQQTRLSLLIDTVIGQFREFLDNPWRKLSLIIIGWFLGFFCSYAISTSVSQAGKWDVPMAIFYILFTELTSIFVYSRPNNKKKPFLELLNSFKLGLVFGLYLAAMIVAS